MSQPVTRELVAELLDELLEVFPRKGVDVTRMAEVYRNTLSDLAGEAVRYAVRRHMREGKYFPKPYELREHGQDWMRRNMPPSVVVAQHSGMYCHCGARFEWLKRWRPKVGERSVPVISSDGVWIALEPIAPEPSARFLCPQCTPRSPYSPEEGGPEHLGCAMRILGPDGKPRIPVIVLRQHPAFQRAPADTS